jgi:hypothetical protein
METPPCSTWSIWVGKEIEGTTDIGVSTLFIRRIPESQCKPERDFSFMAGLGGGIKRVWFCKEFMNWPVMEAIAKHFEHCCIEATPVSYVAIPKRIRDRFQVYIKVSFGHGLNLKPGDVVCVGPAFADEAFTIGQGAKVEPNLYLNDIKIL